MSDLPPIEEAVLRDAFSEVIAAARRLKAQHSATPEMALKLGHEGGRILAAAGLTEDEARHYLHRITASVFVEPQA